MKPADLRLPSAPNPRSWSQSLNGRGSSDGWRPETALTAPKSIDAMTTSNDTCSDHSSPMSFAASPATTSRRYARPTTVWMVPVTACTCHQSAAVHMRRTPRARLASKVGAATATAAGAASRVEEDCASREVACKLQSLLHLRTAAAATNAVAASAATGVSHVPLLAASAVKLEVGLPWPAAPKLGVVVCPRRSASGNENAPHHDRSSSKLWTKPAAPAARANSAAARRRACRGEALGPQPRC
mmetsp:Transcript_24193/g.69834  ORF Transcript_24193/g.69834 Transcript_24193/m.69834 type:complete len:243 (-) Transcript_24193:80-808(-)